MVEIPQDLPGELMAASIEANLSGFFPFFRNLPQAETHIGTDLIWCVTDIPFPLFNSIIQARLDPETVDAHVEAAIARGRSRNIPLLWWVGPATRPTDLGQCLVSRGFIHADDIPGMAVDLDNMIEPGPVPSDFTATEVKDIETLGIWCQTAATGFEIPEFADRTWHHWYTNIGLGPKLRHFLGLWNGRPVATASLFLDAGVAGIYNVAVVQHAQRKGFGAYITLRCMTEARAVGYRKGILQSSSMAVGVYRRLGFREYCRYKPLHLESMSMKVKGKRADSVAQ